MKKKKKLHGTAWSNRSWVLADRSRVLCPASHHGERQQSGEPGQWLAGGDV